MDSRPIGVFDSGLGGLTLVKQIKRVLPGENVIYLGDTARVPYGTRSKGVIQKFSLDDANFLIKKNVKCVVIACNTSSAEAYQFLKGKLKVPVLDVISSVGQNDVFAGSRRVGIVGTNATISSRAYVKTLLKINPKFKIFEKSCPLFVPLIEAGEIKGKILDAVIVKYLDSLGEQKIDTLVLGCTHYPIIENAIGHFFKGGVKLVDPAKGAAIKLKEFLLSHNLESKASKRVVCKYFVTDEGAGFERIAAMFLGEKLTGLVQKIDLE